MPRLSSIQTTARLDATLRPTIVPAAGVLNVKDYGAKGDGQLIRLDTTASSATATAADYTFTAADKGKVVAIAGAGANGAAHRTTIVDVSGSSCTLAAAAVSATTGTTRNAAFGTDDAAAIQDAIYAGLTGSRVFFPSGSYLTGEPVKIPAACLGIRLEGASLATALLFVGTTGAAIQIGDVAASTYHHAIVELAINLTAAHSSAIGILLRPSLYVGFDRVSILTSTQTVDASNQQVGMKWDGAGFVNSFGAYAEVRALRIQGRFKKGFWACNSENRPGWGWSSCHLQSGAIVFEPLEGEPSIAPAGEGYTGIHWEHGGTSILGLDVEQFDVGLQLDAPLTLLQTRTEQNRTDVWLTAADYDVPSGLGHFGAADTVFLGADFLVLEDDIAGRYVQLTPGGFQIFSKGIVANADNPEFGLRNTGGVVKTMALSFEWPNKEWVIGAGLPNNTNTSLSFVEYTDGAFTAVRFAIAKGGNILIGSTADDGANKLQITGNVKVTGNLTVTGSYIGALTVSGAPPIFNVNNNSADGTRHDAYLSYQKNGLHEWVVGIGLPNNTNTAYSIAEYTAGVYQGVRFAIAKGGNVLIGSTTDDGANKLQVTGNVKVTGALTITTPLGYASGGTGFAGYSKGDLLAGIAAGSLAKLAIGSNGQVLTADSAETAGLKWAPADGGAGTIPGSFIGSAPITIVQEEETVTISLAVPLAAIYGGTEFDTYSKGDLLAGNATNGLTRVTAGANDLILIADSTQASGLRWGTLATVPNAGFIIHTADTGFASNALLFQRQGNDGSATGAVDAGKQLGRIDFTGWTGGAYASSAFIVACAEEAFTAAPTFYHGSSLRFIVSPIGINAQWEAMRIAPSGALLIAATIDDGANKLQITGNVKVTGALTITTPLGYASGGTGFAGYSKGDLLAGIAAGSLAKLAVGSNGQVLTADSAVSAGLKWATPATGGITSVNTLTGALTLAATYPLSITPSGNTLTIGFATPLMVANGGTGMSNFYKGDLIVGTGNFPANQGPFLDRLAVGTNGQTLIADSAQLWGLRWGTPAASGVLSVNTFVGALTLSVFAPLAITAESSTELRFSLVTPLAVTYGGTGNSAYTKGDLLVATGTTSLMRLGVGTANQVLMVDSSQSAGMRWATPAAGGVSSVNTLTGALTLAAAAPLTITPSGNTLTIGLTTPLAYNYGGTGQSAYAKGDLLVGYFNGTLVRVPVSVTSGWVLTADSTVSTGMKWAVATGGGAVWGIGGRANNGTLLGISWGAGANMIIKAGAGIELANSGGELMISATGSGSGGPCGAGYTEISIPAGQSTSIYFAHAVAQTLGTHSCGVKRKAGTPATSNITISIRRPSNHGLVIASDTMSAGQTEKTLYWNETSSTPKQREACFLLTRDEYSATADQLCFQQFN